MCFAKLELTFNISYLWFLKQLNVSSDDVLTQYNIPNTATLHCLDNLSVNLEWFFIDLAASSTEACALQVFLCIATCVWHVNSNWPDFNASLPPYQGSENLDLYNPYKEIQFHRNHQLLLILTSMGNQSVKHENKSHKLNTILHRLPAYPQCSDLCYVPVSFTLLPTLHCYNLTHHHSIGVWNMCKCLRWKLREARVCKCMLQQFRMFRNVLWDSTSVRGNCTIG